MNANKLGSILFKAGVLITMVAVVWWGMTYGQKAMDVGAGLNRALTCLYSSGGLCGLTGALTGSTYEPAMFWVGVVLLIAGIVLGMIKR